jgi:hypothetical protein
LLPIDLGHLCFAHTDTMPDLATLGSPILDVRQLATSCLYHL